MAGQTKAAREISAAGDALLAAIKTHTKKRPYAVAAENMVIDAVTLALDGASYGVADPALPL